MRGSVTQQNQQISMNVIGLMSGTSVDGIDAALVGIEEIEENNAGSGLRIELHAGVTYPYSEPLRAEILAVAGNRALPLDRVADLDEAIAAEFARAALAIQAACPSVRAELVGSHGQTVLHRPPCGDRLGYSLQLGRGATIATLTTLPVASNFRAADLAAGGHGAPLVSKVDAVLLSAPDRHRCVQNLGGIGNVTYLPPHTQPDWETAIVGWDTGPGNMLIDLAVGRLTEGRQTYDRDGAWAASGRPCNALVERWLQQDYFQQPPPKSTGREAFGVDYLECCWQDAESYDLSAADWLATLTELTAASVAQSYQQFLPHPPDEVLLCGGGNRNRYLRERLQARLAPASAIAVDACGVDSDYKEAIAFAVLAYWRWQRTTPGNLPGVTGASRPCVLGQLDWPALSPIPLSAAAALNL